MGEIIAVHSGKIMDVKGASTAPGAGIIPWHANPQANQGWMLKQFGTFAGNPLVLIQSAGSGKVLDVAGGSTATGAKLVQNSWTGAVSQWRWRTRSGKAVNSSPTTSSSSSTTSTTSATTTTAAG